MTASERLRAWGLITALSGGALFLTAGGGVRIAGASLLVVAGLLLLGAASAHRREREADARPQAVLAHWSLLAADWAAYVAREKRRLRWLPVLAGGVAGGFGLLDALLRGALDARLLVVPVFAAAGALLGAGLWGLRAGALDAILEEPPSVTLTVRHARFGEETVSWTERPPFLSGGLVVSGARVVPGAVPLLVLSLTWKSLGLPNPFLSRRVRLPVPPGEEAEAEAATARLLAHLRLHEERRGAPRDRLSA